MSNLLYLEDLQEGQQFQSGHYQLTPEKVKAFAREFDPQPFHLDETLAKDTFFGHLVASGWHTAAITMRLMVESFPIADGLIGAGLEELQWLKPVNPTDFLWLQSKILSIRQSKSKPHLGIVRVEFNTYNQHNEVVQRMISSIVVPQKAKLVPLH